MLACLAAMEPLRRDTSPFEGRQPPGGTVFVEPKLVAVEFREWTRSGPCAPSSQGLRPTRTRKNASGKQGKRAPCRYLHLHGTCDLERSDQLGLVNIP